MLLVLVQVRVLSVPQINPYIMNELKLILIGLPIVEIAIFIWLLIRKDRKVVKETRQKIADEPPGRYDEVEYSEQPYYKYFN
jgi:hypothetical protein